MNATVRKAVHFIGIGGIGMSGIAEIMVQSGYDVSGSDLRENDQTRRLKKLGARICIGHDGKNLGAAGVVVFSSAIPRDNPEMAGAKRRGITILSRAQMLAELMRKRSSIVVAGAHGKTTTSAMIASLLLETGFDPTAVIGGRFRRIATNVKLGSGEWFVAESDESDGSFLELIPTLAVITNLDREHMEHYGSFEKLEEAFVRFANRVPFDGVVVICTADPAASKIIPKIERPVVTYGLSNVATVFASDISLNPEDSHFTIFRQGKRVCRAKIPVSGRHNVLNALAAAATGLHLGLSGKEIAKGLSAFSGIDRRLDWKGSARGVRVLDDYAHHPTEIRVTLDTMRIIQKEGSVRVLFQPHRYSRLNDLWESFVSVFDLADEVVVTPIYAASEAPLPNISSERLAKEIALRGKTEARAVSDLEEGIHHLAKKARKGDVLVTMGAGDVTRAGSLLLSRLKGAIPMRKRKRS